MWVTNRYSDLLLKENLTLFKIWTRIYGEMRAKGLLPLFTPLIDYLCFQLLVNVPLNTALAYGDKLIQPQIDASFLSKRLSFMRHMEPSSATSPPPDSPLDIQFMNAVELTSLI